MKNIRWGWILLGGFLAEVLVFVMVIPPSLVAGQQSMVYTAPPASFVACLVFGFWIARKSPRRPILHGTLVGVASMLIYIVISFGQPEPVAYIIAHGLKLLGGAAGGYVALKRAVAKAVPDAPPA